MDKHSVDWHGPMPALVTPFDSRGNVDEAAFKRNVELNIGYGMTGLVVAGCTGEFWALTIEERMRLFELCMEQAGGRVPVIAGTGAIETRHVIALSEHARSIGCSGVMVLPPYFVRPGIEDIIAHYEAVSDAVDIPIMLYNIPSSAVNDLTPALVSRLAEIENVVGIKESSGDWNAFYETLVTCGDRIHVFLGPTTLFGAPAFLMGCNGYIDTLPNLWGAESVAFFDAGAAGDRPRVGALQRKALALRAMVDGDGRNMYCSVKAGMNMLGLPGGYPRAPLRPLGEPHLTEIRDTLKGLGFAVVDEAAE